MKLKLVLLQIAELQAQKPRASLLDGGGSHKTGLDCQTGYVPVFTAAVIQVHKPSGLVQ